MSTWKYSIRATVLACLFAVTAPRAGSNQEAELYVDLDRATAAVESTATLSYAPPGSASVWIGVRIAKARYLDSYAFKVAYDRSKLAFVRAIAAQPDEGLQNFLESRGGSALSFIGKLSIRDSSRVTIGSSLVGMDSSQTPGGEGLLALLEFRPLGSGAVEFGLEEAELLDWEQTLDAPAKVHGALLRLEEETPTASMRKGGRGIPVSMARLSNGMLEMDMGSGGSMQVLDAVGRVVHREGFFSGRRAVRLPEFSRSGLILVIHREDRILRGPLSIGG